MKPPVDPYERDAWTSFIRASEKLIQVLEKKPHTLHHVIMNDIDHRAHDVRVALDKSKYFWRFDLKKERSKAIVLSKPETSTI